MAKLVVLNLEGDFERGFQVRLAIGEESERPEVEIRAALPKAPALPAHYESWQMTYRCLGIPGRIKPKTEQLTNVSITELFGNCHQSAQLLNRSLNQWLASESFRPIREKLLEQLMPFNEIRLIIQTENEWLRRLPWHLWDFFNRYPRAEIALSAPDYERPFQSRTTTYREKVKILAILGSSTGIDVSKDRNLLEQLPDAETTFLVEPQRKELNERLWEQPQDILFFAGHSSSQPFGESGIIYINQTESLTIPELEKALKGAIASGLKIAIFNSCEGLGLAKQLESLHIPQMIVMREPVPDEVAQEFFRHFLTAFSDGKSLYLAIREAREKLQGIEDRFPCATWLPAICQNPAVAPVTWQDLGRFPRTDIEPYRGLFAFREEDAPFFYGREVFIKILLEAVQKQPLIAVIGPSGSGKSSVVFAGLIPMLRQQKKWRIISCRPGDRPLHALATALVPQLEPQLSRIDRLREVRKLVANLQQEKNFLRDVVQDLVGETPNDRLLLVIDQFEELYSLCRNVAERQLFLDRLLEALEPSLNFNFVITLRADFLGEVLSYRPFADALQYADLKLGPMNEEELRWAIAKPAEQLGVTIEKGLTERILDAVSAKPGNLPLLEFALTQLWTKKTFNQLTHAAYDEIGGVETALAGYAEEAYELLNEEHKERAQRIFVQLVRPGDGTDDTRRIATRREVGEENWDLVTRLANFRLVVSNSDEAAGEESVELVHEALIRGWKRLQGWIEFDRAFRIWQERLRSAMRSWEASDRDEGGLLRGAPLAEAESWLLSRPVELSPGERRFIQQSRLLRSQQRRRLIFGLSVGFATASTLAGIAGLQWQRSEKQRQEALAHHLIIQAEGLRNQGAERLPTSVLLAVESMRRLDSPEAEQILHQGAVLLRRPVASYQISALDKKRFERVVALSPNGRYLATAGDESYTFRVWKVASGSEIARSELLDLRVRPDIPNNFKDGPRMLLDEIALSPDGQYIAGPSSDGTVRVWEASSAREVARLLVKNGHGRLLLAFSADGKHLVTVSPEQTVRIGEDIVGFGSNQTIQVWEVKSGREIASIKRNNIEPFSHIALSSDGQYVAAAANGDGTLMWETRSDRLLARLPGTLVALSADGRYLATLSKSVVRVWEVKNNREVARIVKEDSSWPMAFSPDGRYLTMADIRGTVQIWGVLQNWALSLIKFDKFVKAIALSLDGRYLATVSDSDIQVWEAISGRELTRIKIQRYLLTSVAFSPDGQYLVTKNQNNTKQVWEVKSAREVSIPKNFDISGIVFTSSTGNHLLSPNQRYLATINRDHTVEISEITSSGKVLARLKHDEIVRSIAFNSDGKYLATGSDDKIVRVWEIASGQEVARVNHENSASPFTFSPDGRYLVTADPMIQLHLWRREDLIAEVCTLLSRNLTRSEWSQFLGNEPYRQTCPNLAEREFPISRQVGSRQPDPKIITPSDLHKATEFYQQGLALFKTLQYQEAIAAYDKAIEIKTDYYEAWSARSLTLRRLRYHKEALAAADKAIEIQPNFAEAWKNRCGALENLQRAQESVDSCNKALQLKPDYPEALLNRGIALDNLGRYQEALASFDKAIQLKSDYANAWYNRGNTLKNLSRAQEALASYDKAIQIKPDFQEAWMNRGYAFNKLTRYREALASYERAIQLENITGAWCGRGEALIGLKRYKEAVASYDKAIQLLPNNACGWNNRGLALYHLKQYKEAVASFDRALQIQPNYPEAKENRQLVINKLKGRP